MRADRMDVFFSKLRTLGVISTEDLLVHEETSDRVFMVINKLRERGLKFRVIEGSGKEFRSEFFHKHSYEGEVEFNGRIFDVPYGESELMVEAILLAAIAAARANA